MSESLLIQSLGIQPGLAGWQTLQTKSITSFSAFTNDPVLKSNIAYFEANIGKATTVQQFLADPKLQQVAYTAYGLTAQIGANGLMKKVLTSDLSSSKSLANQLTTAGYKQLAAALGYSNVPAKVTPAVSSSAQVNVDSGGGETSIGSFSGTFGGVTLANVDLSAATSATQMAQTLTQAFQSASGNSSITVTALGTQLKFTDTSGHGTAKNFAWTANPNSSVTTATASSPTATVKGSPSTTTAQVTTAVASRASVPLSGLTGDNSFGDFSGTFAGISIANVNLQSDTTPAQIAQSVQAALRKADGGSKNISVTTNGSTLQFIDSAGRGTASGFTFDTNDNSPTDPTAASPINLINGSEAPAAKATASSAQVEIDGLDGSDPVTSVGAFSGTFGGITVQNVNLQTSISLKDIAATLQAAFQKADKGAKNITVTVSNGDLKFSDAAGRGTASGFVWQDNASAPSNPVVSAPTNLINGNAVTSSTANGPNVGDSTAMKAIIAKYQQTMFDNLVGNTSTVLSSALYAQQNLPKITSWYSVIADTKLAKVVETTLGLDPTSFEKIDVDEQNAILSKKMNVKDLANPSKLTALLNKYVAVATAQAESDGDTSSNPAVQILTGNFASSSMTNSSMSSASVGALLMSTSYDSY